MGRFGWKTLLALVPMTAYAATSIDDHDPVLIARVALAVVKIQAQSQQGKTAFGSGVFVGPGEVVTNCHVTQFADAIQVRRGGIWLAVEGQQANVARDLCLLKVVPVALPTPTLRSVEDAAPGQVVFSVGFPGGADSAFAKGNVHALHRFDGSKVIETTTGFRLGASGGALFDDSGRLLGLTTFRARGSRDSHFYAIPADWIAELRKQPVQPVAPLARDVPPFWSLARAQQPYFLQAVPLESEHDWHGLLIVAERWSKEDGNDPDAWYFLGLANARLDRTDDAVVGYLRAVQLNPGFARAWLELGLLYAQLGRKEDVESVRVSLAPLDTDLEQELIKAARGI